MNWYSFDQGKTIGQKGSENGETLLDEEHDFGARITLEKIISRSENYFAVTCGIYGWFFHTHYISPESEALNNYKEMKEGLSKILNLIPTDNEANREKLSEVSDEISKFADKFP